jgi:hypothetical protein
MSETGTKGLPIQLDVFTDAEGRDWCLVEFPAFVGNSGKYEIQARETGTPSDWWSKVDHFWSRSDADLAWSMLKAKIRT